MSGAWSLSWRGFWGRAWGYVPQPFAPSKFITRVTDFVNPPAIAGREEIAARIPIGAVKAFVREDAAPSSVNVALEQGLAVAESQPSTAQISGGNEAQVVRASTTEAPVKTGDNRAAPAGVLAPMPSVVKPSSQGAAKVSKTG